ncbi:MAG: twin-arginine translocase subunit TatC [Verrucomicrobiota bacterium]|nr:twin-arginine translocase subunit TatC [Verrucomicrobiota bacterium]
MADEDVKPSTVPEEEEGGPVKSFLEHLEDLRWVLIRVIASIGLGMAACMVAAPLLVEIIILPLTVSGVEIDLDLFGPIGGIVVMMKIALWGGLTLALPFVLFFIAQFVMPALKKTERVYFRRAFIIGGGLFVIGALMAYALILPISLKGLVQVNEWMGLPTKTWRAEEYFQFAIMFMVGMGLSLEIPVVILTLVRIGVIPYELLIKGRVYFFIGNMVLCAFITPDAVSTIFMVVPVQVLMEICIIIARGWEKKRRIAEAATLKLGNQNLAD